MAARQASARLDCQTQTQHREQRAKASSQSPQRQNRAKTNSRLKIGPEKRTSRHSLLDGPLLRRRRLGAELVGAGEDGALRGWLAAVDALGRGGGLAGALVQGDAAHGGAGFFFDLGFAVGAAAPGGEG